MKTVFTSYGRALLLQFKFKMLMLSLMPCVLAVMLWGVLLYFSLQPLIDFLQKMMVEQHGFEMAGNVLQFLGLLALKAIIVPLLAMWLLLPFMLVTALLFVACFIMPIVNKAVTSHYFPALEQRRGGGWWGSLWFALVCMLVFLLAWLVSLPFSLFLHLGIIIQPLLLGWLTYRVMAYDALSQHASADERRAVLKQHRWRLWTVGIIAGLLGTLPGMLWLGGAWAVLFLPALAALAIWLYVVIFMFTGLWFQCYCLQALQDYRQLQGADEASVIQSH